MTSLFGGGTSLVVGAAGSVIPQQFTPIDGQTLFTLSAFSYIPNTASLWVFVNGDKQRSGIDYTESSSTTFTLGFSVLSTDVVEVIGFPAATLTVTGLGAGANNFLSENQTATAGQLVFTLSSAAYTPGANSLVVYMNGLKLRKGTDYTESSTVSITLVSAASLGDELDFIIGATVGSAISAGVVGIIQSGTGAVARTVQDKLREQVSVKDFGAVCDGSTDDTAAVQAAVNYCSPFDIDLLVPGMCKINPAVMVIINRAVGAHDKQFRIIGVNGGGFLLTTTGAMFTSSTAFTTDPVSEMVCFENINFQSPGGATGYYVLNDGRFLRMKFSGCTFQSINMLKLAGSCNYIQSIYTYDCNIRHITGLFIDVPSLGVSFDFHFRGNICEAISGSFIRIGFPQASYVTGNLIEGVAGTALIFNGCQGFSIHSNYFEANITDIDMTGTQLLSGLDIRGNAYSRASYAWAVNYAVLWGTNRSACVTEGNFTDGKMHSFSPNNSVGVRMNDTATVTVSSVGGQYQSITTAPAFSAYANADQVVTNGVFTKITLAALEFDTDSKFSSSRFTPTIPGYYRYSYTFQCRGDSVTRFAVGLYKNGIEVRRLNDQANATLTTVVVSGSGIVYLSSTDYIELWGFLQGTTSGTTLKFSYDAPGSTSAFSADLVRQ